MGERSQFWQTGTTGDGAATITEAQTIEWFRDLATPRADANAPNTTQGPLRGVLGELAVTGSASPVSVAAGAACVAGFYYKNDAAVNVAIPTPAAATRIDRIVLRASHGTTRTVRITRIAGTEGAGAPALTQTAGTTWDIPLAQASITTGGVITITDQRAFAQLATNHVKRDGDTMTGALTAPSLTATGALSSATAAISGAATVGSLNGGTPWTTANDGQGSGLDADLVAGVAIEPLQRQGGNASNWSTPGATNYAPTATREQWGVANVTLSSSIQGSANVTFPVAFSNPPIVLATIQNATDKYVVVSNITTTGFTLTVWSAISGSGTFPVGWLAQGPA